MRLGEARAVACWRVGRVDATTNYHLLLGTLHISDADLARAPYAVLAEVEEGLGYEITQKGNDALARAAKKREPYKP